MNVLDCPFPTTPQQIAAIDAYWQASARDDFYTFRHYMHPELLDGWWQREIAKELTDFSERLLRGERPMLLIQAPPQHGKSTQVTDFIAWLSGHAPHLRTIYTSFSERLGVRANLSLQRMYDGRKYKETFDTRISDRNAVTVSGQTLRNREILEYVGKDGFFRNTTVRGSITGEGLDLGIIDDPIKGREEANSETVRDRTWDWLTDDFMSRFSEMAGLLGIMTRWHVDDPFGRLIKSNSNIRVLRYPAIAEKDEAHRKTGEALFPEHKSTEFLLTQKAAMHGPNWEALYQQSPVIIGGNMFKDTWWRYYQKLPALSHRIIFADTAQKTKQSSDYTVLQCWGYCEAGNAYLIDQVRDKMEAPDLLTRARQFWHSNKAIQDIGPLRSMNVEDKVSGTGLIQTLNREGIPVIAIQRNTDKVTRAYDVVPMVESGKVFLPQNAPWLKDYLDEFNTFPNGAHDDQVDPTIDAVNELVKPKPFVPMPMRVRI